MTICELTLGPNDLGSHFKTFDTQNVPKKNTKITFKEENLGSNSQISLMKSYNCNFTNISSIYPQEAQIEDTKDLSYDSGEFEVDEDTDERAPFRQVINTTPKKSTRLSESPDNDQSVPDETYI
jgi:hypothetical protein